MSTYSFMSHEKGFLKLISCFNVVVCLLLLDKISLAVWQRKFLSCLIESTAELISRISLQIDNIL